LKLPESHVTYDAGTDLSAAAALAAKSEVAIVFVQQWESEGMDLPSLALPDNQDALVEAVAAANPHTIVVLETGTAALMPWKDKVAGIVEAWYPGSRGATALANILTGEVNPSAKLPMTFPLSDADLPHLTIPELSAEDKNQGRGAVAGATHVMSKYSVTYDEALKVGYKWYDAEHKSVLYPFGYGLSYTTYSYSGLKVTPGASTTITFTVTNTGKRDGSEIAEVYAMLPAAANEPPKRLVGFAKVKLAAGESRDVMIAVEPKYLSIFDEARNGWKLVPGEYTFAVGGSSEDLGLKQSVTLSGNGAQ
jgi:beta-glucosidase